MAVLGIDLGKATCSAVVQPDDGGEPMLIQVEPVVALTPRNGWLAGEQARLAAAAGGGEAVWDLLELQGRKMSDITAAQIASWPFRLVQGTAGKALVEFHTKSAFQRAVFAPEELLAVLLASIRQLAEQRSNSLLEDAVVTVPATWNHTQRRALRIACEMAGLTVLRLVVPSTAAGIAHAVKRAEEEQDVPGQLMLVVDFGASSVNVSMLSLQSLNRVEVKAVVGDSTLGGVTLTERIVSHFLQDRSLHPSAVSAKALPRLRRASQLAKKILSTSDTAAVQLQLETGAFAGSITRAQFERACSDCWGQIGALIQVVLDDSHVAKEQVHSVLLCGGSAVLRAVQELMQSTFPGKEVLVNAKDCLQARGAATLAASMADILPTVELADVAPLALGVQRIGTKDVTVLVPANSRLPFTGENLFFAGSQTSDLVYRVLEGRNLRQLGPPHADAARPLSSHCIGTVRLVRASAARTALAQLVTKLTITLELDENLELAVSIVDLTTRQSGRTIFMGDETGLTRDAIEQTRTELDSLFGGHRDALLREVTEQLNHPLPGRVGDTGTNPTAEKDKDGVPEKTLQTYALALRAMVDTNTLEIKVADDEKLKLTTKIDNVLEWLHSNKANKPTNNQQSTPPVTTSTNDDPMNGLHATKADSYVKRVNAHLQALRRLHFSIAASSAIAHLRETDSEN